ncbi:MAG TPA: FHA domain-containing protein [Polyangiales bacterium]|nr:FHA domain-containing protein [Polyangiales bacterium]
MSDRVSPPARAVVTPAAAQSMSSTLHESTPPSRPVRRAEAEFPAQPISGEVPATTRDGEEARVEAREPTKVCPSCNAPGLPGMKFCRECGTALAAGGDLSKTEPQPVPAPASCWRCHGKRDAGAVFCRFCGASFVEATAAAPRVTPMQSQPVELPQLGAARLVTLLKDGSEGRSIPLVEGDADVGASEGGVTFPDDPYMSPRHARVSFRNGSYTLRDLDSVNGVYVRLREELELRDRDTVLIGQQVLRFEVLADGELSLGPAWQRGVLVFGTPEAARFARLVQYTTEGVARDVHYLFRDETVIGRENGDIVFTDDPFLSRRHAAVRVDHARRRYTLHDLGSSNGTALRIRGEHVLRDGDQFRVGRHLFRYEAGPLGGRAGR